MGAYTSSSVVNGGEVQSVAPSKLLTEGLSGERITWRINENPALILLLSLSTSEFDTQLSNFG